eukprot:2061950-Amphidinium_carterae.2
MADHGGHDHGGRYPPPPSWDGSPHNWRKFQQELKLWRLSIPPPTSYSAGARVAMGLTGAARRVAMTLVDNLAADPNDPWASLNRLESALQQLVPASDTRTTQLLDRFFSTTLGERKQHESVNSFNSVFLTLLHHLQDEGIDTANLYIGYWYLRKMRISREQRERILQYAYAQSDFSSTRRLLERARAQGRTGVRERGAIASGSLRTHPEDEGTSTQATQAQTVRVPSTPSEPDEDFRFQASDVTVYNDLPLLMSVAVRLLPDIHMHEKSFPKGTPKGAGAGKGQKTGKSQRVYLADSTAMGSAPSDDASMDWQPVDAVESTAGDEEMPSAWDEWGGEEQDGNDEISHAEDVLQALLAGDLGTE